MTPLLPMSAARVFFDGIFTDPRVAHPEGVAVHADGSIWCGNELGELLRIAADGSKVERMGTTDGFALGIAFNSAGNCFVCDLKHAAVFRYDAASRTVEKFAASGILVPNYPIVDEKRGVLYVSDSRGEGNIGPGIFRYDLKTGEGGVWSRAPMNFANGMAMALDGNGLYVVESHGPHVSYVPIEADGSAGTPRIAVNRRAKRPRRPRARAGRHALHLLLRAEPHLPAEAGRDAGIADRGSGGDHHRASHQYRPQGQHALHRQSRTLAHHRDRSLRIVAVLRAT